jgi:hypothetical protein
MSSDYTLDQNGASSNSHNGKYFQAFRMSSSKAPVYMSLLTRQVVKWKKINLTLGADLIFIMNFVLNLSSYNLSCQI